MWARVDTMEVKLDAEVIIYVITECMSWPIGWNLAPYVSKTCMEARRVSQITIRRETNTYSDWIATQYRKKKMSLNNWVLQFYRLFYFFLKYSVFELS